LVVSAGTKRIYRIRIAIRKGILGDKGYWRTTSEESAIRGY
jgi:hypothetical protein